VGFFICFSSFLVTNSSFVLLRSSDTNYGINMICISINQESRRLALVDMLNAARQCDLLEVRLDRFGKAPEVGELLAAKPKPVIMCCRRAQDGGNWDGGEEERLALLRQCIISKADYVEIELDVADQIRRFPPSQRVISYTNLQETPSDIADIYAEAQTKNPDVIKLVTLARTPEEAWPLVQILGKARVPTVVVGLGKPGIMLSILGKKIGAPWTYAALERGMEAYPGQATVSDLIDVYHYGSIEKGTRLIGVTGFGEREVITTAVQNSIMANLQLPARCLPLGVGNVKLFRKVMEAVKLAGAIVDQENQQAVAEIATELHSAAKQVGAVDVLVHKGEAWHGFNTYVPALLEGLTQTLKAKMESDNPIKGRMVVLVGLTPPGRALAAEIQRQGASVILASHQKKAGQQAAQELGCRFIQFEALYSTMHDVLIVCEEEKDPVPGRSVGVHAGYLKKGMTVMDLTAMTRRSEFLEQAAQRGTLVVEPRQVLLSQLEAQCKLLTGKHVRREVIDTAVPEQFAEE
jgi:3-dehydroquinate dehydratase/shikimate dehydrogenase